MFRTIINKLKSCFDLTRDNLEKIGIKYHKSYLFERLTKDEIPIIKTKIPFKIKIATTDNIEKLGNLKNEALKRINKGDVGFLAFAGNKLAGWSWICIKKNIYMNEFDRNFIIGNNTGYQYDGLVFPEYRRNNLHKKLIEENVRYLKLKNIKKIISFTDKKNIISQKTLYNFNCYRIKEITYLRIFFYKRYKEIMLR